MMRRFSALLVLGALLAVALAPRTAHAQLGVDAQLFHPALDSYGIFTVDRADVSHQFDFGFKLYLNFAGNPLRLNMSDPGDGTHTKSLQTVLLGYQAAMNIGVHLGLTNWLELVLDVPISAQSYTAAFGNYGSFADGGPGVTSIPRTGFYTNLPYTNVPPPDAAANDVRIGFKLRFLRSGMFGLGASAIVTLPFGDTAAFLGDSGFTFQPKIIGDITRGPITAAINIGAVIRQETVIYDPFDQAAIKQQTFAGPPRVLLDVGHELTYGVGVSYRFVQWVGIGAEFAGLIPLVGVHQDFTADALGGLQLFPSKDLAIAIGGGANVFTSASRHDDYRAFLGLTWAPVEGGKGAVAVGGLDSDNDGITDAQDLCPNEPEDKDGFDDEDGCPDPDNDQDGIPDKLDRCPNEPEDKDGFQDDDGCPDLDNDGDGIPDAQDRCPNDPEDKDGFQDDDGCPDLDNDGDGIPDAVDKCPNEPETRNGVDDDDGCPDTGGAVVLAAGRITLPQQLQFDTARVTVAARSEALLDRVAEKIKANPQVKRIRIEGHTDDVGDSAKNQQLSQARAEAVREFLIKKGIEPERLQAVGYGDSRPLERRKTAEARARNRRVEFIIVEQ